MTSTKPSAHLASRKRVAESGVPEVEPRLEVVAGRAQERHQDRRLGGDPHGGADAEQRLLAGREGGAGVGLAEGDQEQQQDADGDDVVGDRAPTSSDRTGPGR